MTYEHKPPAVSEPVLLEPEPTASAPADVKIAHVQLRNLIVCPHDRGVVWYVGTNCIIEHDILDPLARPQILARLAFTPVTLTTLSLPENRILLAAGGQDRELFLALYHPPTPSTTCNSSSPLLHSPTHSSTPHSHASASSVTLESDVDCDMSLNTQELGKRPRELLDMRRRRKGHGRHSREVWQHSSQFEYPASINNSVMLYLPPAAESPKGAWTTPSISPASDATVPRLIVSNNDRSIKFLVISLTKGGFGKRRREGWFARGNTLEERQYEIVGTLQLPVPVNHTSVSPDGSTLLSCGDSSSIYLHRIISKPSSSSYPRSPTYTLEFEPLITLCLPSSPSYPLSQSNPYLPFAYIDGAWTVAGAPLSSCFATAWNKDGSKFAVASQEGMVLVWDVRSGEPLEGARWETVRVEDADEKDKGSLNSNMELNGTWIRDAAGELMREGGIDVDDVAVWYANQADAPSWGIRVLKFARNASGKEILVFTEHASNIHVIDAETFSIHDVIRIPHVPLCKPTPPSPSPPSLHIEDVSSPSTNRHHDYPTQSYERSGRDLLSSFNLHDHDHSPGPGPASSRVAGYISPRGYMTGAVRPMAVGGPRHTSTRTPSRILNSNLPFSRSPERMAHEQSPRRRSTTLPSNAPRPPWLSGVQGARNVLPPPPSRRRHIPAIPPGGLTTRRSSFESNRSPGRDVRERMAAEMRDMGVNIDDAVMEEDIAWNMILDAIERDDVGMATEQERNSQRDRQSVQAALESARVNATERLREVLIGQPTTSALPPRRNAAPQNQNQPTDTERAEARFFSYLETMGLQIDNASSTAARGGTLDGNISAGVREEEMLGPDDWEYECTTPPPLFSTDLTRAVSAGATGSGSSTDTDTIGTQPPGDPNIAQTGLPNTQPLGQDLSEASPTHSELSSPRAALPPFRELIEVTDGRRLDIAGVCFDPTGAHMYVATVDGITEWKVKGSELRWWGGGGFL